MALSAVVVPLVRGFSYAQLVCSFAVLAFIGSFSFFCQGFNVGGAGKNGSTIAMKLFKLQIRSGLFIVTLAIYAGLFLTKGTDIVCGGSGKNGSTAAGTSVLSPVIPLSFAVVPAYIIYRKSETGLYENHPALYILAFGFVAAKVTNRLVVAHMTKSELGYLDTALVGPAMLFLNQYFNFFFNEYYILWACLIWVTLDLVRYSTEICNEICEHLRIRLFKIPYPPPPGRTAPINGQAGNGRVKRPSRGKR